MRLSALKYTVLSWTSNFTLLILLLVPFQGFLTVWLASVVGHYTAIRLWDEVLLTICSLGVIYLLLTDQKIRFNTLSRRLVWLIIGYLILTVAWGIIAYTSHDVTAKALGYGLIVNLRYLIFFLVTWAAALRLGRLRNNWQWAVLWPAAIVVFVGLLQAFILPHDFMKHFGYGPSTIPVEETINHNSHYMRVASTLRGANPLGAYLIIPISILSVLILKGRRSPRNIALLVASLVVLFYSFSRSALIGAVISIALIIMLGHLSAKVRKYAAIAGAAIVLLAIIASVALHNNVSFQNFVLHTQSHSAVKSTSNEGHLSYLKMGLKDIIHDPLGKGPGTAGPASYYNANQPRIAEDYYVQIGQEVGWLGLILFLLINLGVGYILWLNRDDPLSLALFASLIGISFVNLLSHAWTDDTLAYIWWGLAGIAMAPKRLDSASTKTVKK